MFGTLFPSQSIAPPPPLSATLPIKLFAKSSTFDALTRRAAPPSPKAAVYTTCSAWSGWVKQLRRQRVGRRHLGGFRLRRHASPSRRSQIPIPKSSTRQTVQSPSQPRSPTPQTKQPLPLGSSQQVKSTPDQFRCCSSHSCVFAEALQHSAPPFPPSPPSSLLGNRHGRTLARAPHSHPPWSR